MFKSCIFWILQRKTASNLFYNKQLNRYNVWWITHQVSTALQFFFFYFLTIFIMYISQHLSDIIALNFMHENFIIKKLSGFYFHAITLKKAHSNASFYPDIFERYTLPLYQCNFIKPSAWDTNYSNFLCLNFDLQFFFL